MERLIGQYCKIVTKEPGEDRASVVSGTLEDVDYKDGFILVDSSQGLGCLRIDTIIAIKPGNKRKKEQNLHDDEKAMVGIGTLIIFIAMTLVAAIAASILVQTAETLQQRAYAVGKQTIREVSSGMKVIDQTGYTNTNRTKLQYLALSVKLRAGSYDIDLTETLLYISYDNLTVLTHTNVSGLNADGASNDGIFHTLNHSALNATVYGTIATHDSDDSVTANYGMSTDDTVIFMINLTAAFEETEGLPPGESFIIRLVPEVGNAGSYLVEAPMVFEHRVVQL